MLAQRMLFDFEDVISSAESQDGNSRLNSLDSRMKLGVGREVALASHIQRREKVKAVQTLATCGLPGFDLSESVSLNGCLANKCRQLLGMDGSTDCVSTWKEKTTPLGRSFWEHIPLSSTTQGSDFTGGGRLPTPQSMDAKGYSEKLKHKFRKTGHLKHWVHGTLLAIHSVTGVSSWPNPMLCEWMMGFPRLWISGRDYTPTETQLSRR